MLAVTTLFLLYIIQCITANTTTAAQRAQQEAIAACQNLTSSTTGDGTTTTTLLFPNPSCWDSLGMTDWMSNWNTTTTICTATQSVLTPCQCRIDEPMGLIVSGVSQLPPGSRSTSRTGPLTPGLLLALFNYLTTWYTSLTSFTALPAITHELSQTKTSALSANNLLIALVQDYAIDASLSQALVSIISKGPLFRNNDASTRPTLSNAQKLLGQLLQKALEVVTSDWACGDFQAMANGGMLLNGTLETTEILDARLGQQESE
ncbi:MAG: hypothetical protein ASARMPRED_001400 [Alectoria sarmentosa]|nr:MAG: hypothetical protein ASARMPRED_001400 [Alectoria sarmentosa]